MSRGLQSVNLVGVLALAALCVVQWRHDRRLNLDVNRLDQTRQQQAAKIDEQANALKGLNGDLGQLKSSLADEKSMRQQAEDKSTAIETTNEQLKVECSQLKGAISNWADAVAVRDQHMKEANSRIEQLAADL